MGTETLSKRAAYNKNWASENREKIRANSLKYWRANKEKARLAARKRRLANPEKEKAYGRKYRAETSNAAAKKYRAKYPERVLAARAKHRAANLDRIKAQAKAWRDNNRDKIRHYAYKRKYGVSRETYESMIESQGHKCALCGSPPPLVIDHCHVGGRVRGLLCANCNIGIGLLKHSPDVLRKAAAYIDEHN